MDRFENVTIVKKANIYFEGKVTSRTVLFPNGEKKTLGIMLPGDYEFGTDLKELMEILDGEMEIQLKDETSFRQISAGDSFYVPAKSSFKLIVKTPVDYCCSYISEE